MDLKDKKCSSPAMPAPVLNQEKKQNLLKDLGSAWAIEESSTRLTKRFKFKNFKETLNFVNRISEISEIENHHPEICFGWGYCALKIWTHTNNNLTENDFILAAKCEEAFNLLDRKSSSNF